VVLTPNGGELAALLDGEEREGLDAARWVAERYGAVVAAQGWVATPGGDSWADEAGGIGLGTSGSGDVLAGAVGGLLARGAEPPQAAVWGQYLHAAAGDRLAARVGRVGFLARELLDELPLVLTGLRT
jgi:NAD(P)H-hydrate repair Nnr-like enzyme with NAD(P)H-hydrate dehydratase domain